MIHRTIKSVHKPIEAPECETRKALGHEYLNLTAIDKWVFFYITTEYLLIRRTRKISFRSSCRNFDFDTALEGTKGIVKSHVILCYVQFLFYLLL